MAQLNVRLDDNTRDSLDALARAKGTNASDLVRGLIEEALGLDSDRPYGSTAPRSLSAVQRRTLVLLHEALGLLTAEEDEEDDGYEAAHHRRMVEVLSRGYVTEYSDMFLSIETEMSERDAALVFDLLDMFTFLESTYERLTDEEKASLGKNAEHALSFRGFDYNDSQEGRMASFAKYVISTGRWENMSKHFDAANDGGNSHMPMLASYQRMLSVWKPMHKAKVAKFSGFDSYRFTFEELQEIVAAWPHPRS